jgi:hypothetical protein
MDRATLYRCIAPVGQTVIGSLESSKNDDVNLKVSFIHNAPRPYLNIRMTMKVPQFWLMRDDMFIIGMRLYQENIDEHWSAVPVLREATQGRSLWMIFPLRLFRKNRFRKSLTKQVESSLPTSSLRSMLSPPRTSSQLILLILPSLGWSVADTIYDSFFLKTDI